VTDELPPWPETPPAHGSVVLREIIPADVAMAIELSTDPYMPVIGTLPANATQQQAREWIERQRPPLITERQGMSFAIADRATDRALGQIGLWLAELPHGRANAGYSVVPSARGRGIATAALIALTKFAWTIPGLHRVQLHIEPGNAASVRTAERAGYQREGLLRSYQAIGGERRDMLLHAAIRPS
jgi:RimJ/RimL family protein N-acetyltransferase